MRKRIPGFVARVKPTSKAKSAVNIDITERFAMFDIDASDLKPKLETEHPNNSTLLLA